MYWTVTQGEQTSYYPYMEDPEGTSDEWYDYIWADNRNQAIQRCRAYAERNGLIYVRVRQVGRGAKYECYVRPYA